MDVSELFNQMKMSDELMNKRKCPIEPVKMKCDCGLDEDHASHHSEVYILCETCGFVFLDDNISKEAEWNCYRDYTGASNTSNVRCHVNRDVTNPYDKGLPQAFPTGWKQTYVDDKGNKRVIRMDKRNLWFIPYKQKAFWEISQLFDRAITRLVTTLEPKLSVSKKLWHHIMESGVVSRGANRRGLIANCLVYACKIENNPRKVQDIAQAFQIDPTEITRGHKIFKEIMTDSEYEYILYDNNNDNHLQKFIKHIDKLGLKFKVAKRCGEILEKYGDIMNNVAPQSKIAGIISWVVHIEMKLKKPNKSSICKEVSVCSPTLKKVVGILESLIKKE
jgi:transcription initiation factor TFIIIB Brf1 subunit/transcription initiation factor TFIIB